MTKSIMGMLVGIAIADGAIGSVDDVPQRYVPGFKGSEYGRTPIRDLLHMSSGVEFGEEREGGRDLNRLWRDMVLGTGMFQRGTLDSITQFNHRIAAPGTRFHYASIEPDVLGALLHHVLGRSLSDYLQDKLWHPIGAEADATWLVDAQGIEVAHFGFSAVLRDYARIGRLLAMDGAWDVLGTRMAVRNEAPLRLAFFSVSSRCCSSTRSISGATSSNASYRTRTCCVSRASSSTRCSHSRKSSAVGMPRNRATITEPTGSTQMRESCMSHMLLLGGGIR
jgi:CubicO group peptidase (beta-lactamase class C family)